MYPYRAPYTIVTNISINQNSYSWNVADAYGPYAGTLPVCAFYATSGRCVTPH
jgi:hypothetical protein